jgi:hypothetical protein
MIGRPRAAPSLVGAGILLVFNLTSVAALSDADSGCVRSKAVRHDGDAWIILTETAPPGAANTIAPHADTYFSATYEHPNRA